MNTEIADVGKMQQYVSHYIEIYGKTQKNNDELDSAVFDTICNAAKDRGMSVTCQYETQDSCIHCSPACYIRLIKPKTDMPLKL